MEKTLKGARNGPDGGTCLRSAPQIHAVQSAPMSRTLARLLIGFMLALAIPAQGMAALSAGFCMTMGQHHEQGSAAMGHGPASSHHADGDHQPASEPLPNQEQSSSTAHCPPCVSCCAAVAIAPAMPTVHTDQSASAAFAAIPHSLPGALPEELDRPPLAL